MGKEVFREEIPRPYSSFINELEEENRKLNIKVASLEGEIKGLISVIDKLKEENQTLELWLDKKEKVNKKLKMSEKRYKNQYDFDEECLRKLKEENKKLKDTIKDHQLYEEKLEHRIIEFEELLHGE